MSVIFFIGLIFGCAIVYQLDLIIFYLMDMRDWQKGEALKGYQNYIKPEFRDYIIIRALKEVEFYTLFIDEVTQDYFYRLHYVRKKAWHDFVDVRGY